MSLSRARRLGKPASLFVCGAFIIPCRPALAYEARVSAQHDAQFYGVQSPFGSPEVLRRRHTSALGLELDDLAGLGARGPKLEFRARLRLDADFGQLATERDPSSNRFVPGLEQAPLDLLYAYVAMEGLAAGALGLRVGRQVLVDPLGFFSFDGGRLAIVLPLGLELGAYAGIEPRPGLPLLATARYLGDGVRRGGREQLELDREPSYLDESELSPAAGAWLTARALGPLSASLAYRRVVNRSRVRLSPFAAFPGDEPRTFGDARISSERFGASARLDWPEVGSVSGLAQYDLYLRRFNEVSFDFDALPSRSLRAGVELRRSRPSFDADSIFNWFAQGETNSALIHVAYLPWPALDTQWSGGVRWFETEEDAGLSGVRRNLGAQRDLTGSVSGRFRFDPSELSLTVLGEVGDRGRLAGADLGLRSRFAGGQYDSLVLLSLFDWSNPLRVERNATSFSYVLGAGLWNGAGLFSQSRLGLEWEHAFNRLVSQRFRVLATLQLGVFR